MLKSGKIYGRLTIVEYLDGDRYLCDCDCGNEKIVLGSNMVRGLTQSCGCLQKEAASKNTKRAKGAGRKPWKPNSDWKWYMQRRIEARKRGEEFVENSRIVEVK